MKNIYEFINIKDAACNVKYQNIEMVIYSMACFFIPLFIGHPQLVVGIIINTLLISSALSLKGYRLLPVIIMPGLGALSRGILFGPFTVYLLYLIPFIWLGNALLVFAFKYFKLNKKINYWITLLIGITLKSGFLFLAALALFKLGIIPAIFLAAMGITQLITAFCGGVAAFGYEKIRSHNFLTT